MSHQCIAIHRGRNKETTRLFKSVTDVDYTFDFRGIHGGSPLNPFWLLIKAWITSKEVPPAKNYLVEGGMLFWIGYFLKKKYPNSRLILMVPEAAYFLDPKKNFIQKIFFHFRIKSMRDLVDLFLPITEMVKQDILASGTRAKVERVPHSVDFLPSFHSRKSDITRIMFVMDRPQDTSYIKGWDRVQKIARKLERDQSFQFFVCGSGTEVLKSHLPNITFCGRVHMVTFLSDIDICLTPSRYDALCRVVGEAVSTGTIPLMSQKVGIKEVFTDFPELIVDEEDIDLWVSRIQEISTWTKEQKRSVHYNVLDKMKEYQPEDVLLKFQKTISQFIGV